MDCAGQQFDPTYHNAVMHVEDDSYEENVIVEEMQKGYMYKDQVLRFSMVKVANQCTDVRAGHQTELGDMLRRR